MKCIRQTLISTMALLMLSCAVGAQQAPPAKPEPAKPKAKKVWSNDDVTTLRTPVDNYEDAKRKQADEAAAKASQQAATAQSPGDKQKAKPKDYLPKTLEDAEKLAAAKQYEIGQQHESIDRAKQEQAEATTDEARAGFQKRIDELNATLEESIAEMHALDARLKELKANPPPPEAPKPTASADVSAAQPVADLEKQIAVKQEKIEHLTGYVQPLRDAVATADSDTVRASLQKKLDGFLAAIEKENAELKALESRLQELKSSPPASPKPPTPQP